MNIFSKKYPNTIRFILDLIEASIVFVGRKYIPLTDKEIDEVLANACELYKEFVPHNLPTIDKVKFQNATRFSEREVMKEYIRKEYMSKPMMIKNKR